MVYFSDKDLTKEYIKLKEKYEILEEENIQLRKKLLKEESESQLVNLIHLFTKKEFIVLKYIFNSKHLAKADDISDALYYFENDDLPESNTVYVFISKINKKLKPYNIRISNARGRGYYISDRDKIILQSIGQKNTEIVEA